MTSRFFATGDTTSESESDDVSSSEDEITQPMTGGGTGIPRTSRFLADSDSDSDDVKRVVKSAKDKRNEAICDSVQKLRNFSKINDWTSIQNEFETLNKLVEKSMSSITFGGQGTEAPTIYIGSLIFLDDAVQKAMEHKSSTKLSKTNIKALNSMKQRVRKLFKSYDEQVASFKSSGLSLETELSKAMDDDANDAASSDDDELDSDSDSQSEKDEKKVVSDSDSDSEKDEKKETKKGSDWGSGSEDGDESDSDSDGFVEVKGKSRASQWLKKEDDEEKTVKKQKERKNKAKQETDSEEEETEKEKEKEKQVAAAKKTLLQRLVAEETEGKLTEAIIDDRLIEVIATRGRKGTNRKDQLEALIILARAAKVPRQIIEVNLHLISAQFDQNLSTYASISQPIWREALLNVKTILNIAKENYPELRFSDEIDQVSLRVENNLEPSSKANGLENGTENGSDEKALRKNVRGDLASLVERLDDELFKAWQNIDAYSPEYSERLRDENPFLTLAGEVQHYYEKIVKDLPRAARIASRILLHIYYRTDDLNSKIAEANMKSRLPPDYWASDLTTESGVGWKSLQELAVLVYRYGEERAKSQTMLCHIHNHALMNRFYEARDMLLMSHLQETIAVMDIPLQVLFNRTMAQLGLCAFRLGMPWETHNCLQEICSPSFSGGGGSAKVKELLAQGIIQQKGYDKTPEQEKAERRRQIPYHMHLSLDFLEMAHLVSAMLLEVPTMALNALRGEGSKRRVISKTFQYYLRNSMKQSFPGPPENTRDHVMAATNCLMKGDWKECHEYVSSIRGWNSVSPAIANSTLALLRELIKKEALRTFVLTYSTYYDSMATSQLSEVFELPVTKVHSIISKMIINGELRASWDQPTGSVVMRRTEPTHLQGLALQLTHKIAQMVDQNEKLLEARAGTGKDGDEKRGADGSEWFGFGNSGRSNTGHSRGRGGRGRGRGMGRK